MCSAPAHSLTTPHIIDLFRHSYVEAIQRLNDWRATQDPLNPKTRSVHGKVNALKMKAHKLTETHSLPDIKTPLGAAECIVRYAGAFPLESRWQAWTSRAGMLEALDQSKHNGHISWSSDMLGPSVLTVSLYGIKLTGQHAEVQLKQPLHEIAAVNVCEDDGIWFIFIKTGTGGEPHTYTCHVCECGVQQDAEEVAALIRSNVESAYTKVGLPFNKTYVEPREVIPAVAAPIYATATSPDAGPQQALHTPRNAAENTQQRTARIRLASRPLSESPEVPWGDSPEAPWEAEADVVEAFPKPDGPVNTSELVSAYMTELRSVLTQKEIREFASVLRALRFKSLQLDEFCTKLKSLFGDDRMWVSTLPTHPSIYTCTRPARSSHAYTPTPNRRPKHASLSRRSELALLCSYQVHAAGHACLCR
jgi:hypothetical protein